MQANEGTRMRSLTAALTLVLGVGMAAGTGAAPAQADTRAMPGSFTGFAFDTCDAPSQRAMDAWRTSSVFWGVGIYIAGMNRACDAQPNLTRTWVRTQAARGWRLLPIVVGRQASCSPKGRYVGKRINSDPTNSYAAARKQGRADARTGITAARDLGIGRGSVLWFDLEGFDSSRDRCRRSALAFVSGWTNQLHDRGWKSGLYSSASSGITATDYARRTAPDVYRVPDYLWIAEWNGKATVRSAYIDESGWWPHRRVHQYRGDHVERHGGVAINIDSNYMSTGTGTRGGRPARHCGVRVNFARYPELRRGDSGPLVKAAQCLLKQQRRYDGRVHGRYTKQTARAVRRFQDSRAPLAETGVLTRRTWTALLSTGPAPLTKFGSGGNHVRRLQRALNSAQRAGLAVDGVFARKEMRAVRAYQRDRGLRATGVVTSTTWNQLKRGRH